MTAAVSTSTGQQTVRHVNALQHVSDLLFVAMHASVAFALVVPFSSRAMALALGGYAMRMCVLTAGYHRYFAHRSYRTSRAFQFVLAVLGCTCMQNGPIWWASVHRRHHKYADRPGDPHSPILRGFWYAHVGWIFDRTVPGPRDESNVQDLTRYPELRWIDRHDWLPLTAFGLGCYAIGGGAGLVWGFVIGTLAVFHSTMLVNSLAHVWGSRRYQTSDGSRNNLLIALLTFGEGWHNNHHHYMSSARQGVVWWEVDITYYVLWCLGRLRLVWDLRQPPDVRRGAYRHHFSKRITTNDSC